MRNISLILGTLFLSGCAMGINQSVATINNKPYLVEKKTYVFPIPFYQWSTKAAFTPLEITDENKLILKQTLDNAKHQCSKINTVFEYKECLTKYFN